MNEATKNQKGSPSRDEFKRRHKDLHKDMWATDLDFVLVEKQPFPDIVAALDYKVVGDKLTFSEVIAYNALIRRGIPVFVVSGNAADGEFIIYEYIGGNHVKPRIECERVIETKSWDEFEAWERTLRKDYRAKFSEKK